MSRTYINPRDIPKEVRDRLKKAGVHIPGRPGKRYRPSRRSRKRDNQEGIREA